MQIRPYDNIRPSWCFLKDPLSALFPQVPHNGKAGCLLFSLISVAVLVLIRDQNCNTSSVNVQCAALEHKYNVQTRSIRQARKKWLVFSMICTLRKWQICYAAILYLVGLHLCAVCPVPSARQRSWFLGVLSPSIQWWVWLSICVILCWSDYQREDTHVHLNLNHGYSSY